MSNYLTDQDLTNIVERTLYADQDDALSMAFEIRTYRAQVQAGWRPPACVITTVEDIAGLSVGSILVDHEGDSWQLFARGWRCPASESGWSDWSDNWLDATDVVQVAPLTVLHTPENGDTR